MLCRLAAGSLARTEQLAAELPLFDVAGRVEDVRFGEKSSL